MLEHVGLRSKVYSHVIDGGKTEKKCKGVKKCTVKNNITFEDYKNCLFNQVDIYKTMNLIRSKKHEIYSIKVNKKALSATDDKRCILENGIDTLPWGHFRLLEN